MSEPQRLPLAVKPSNRDESTSRDAKIVNGYVEKVGEKDIQVYKRPGYAGYAAGSTGSAAAGLGSYNWNGDLFAIFGSTLYKNNVAVTGTVNTTNGVYSFASCLGANPKLVFQNGVAMYTYDAIGGIVQVPAAVAAPVIGNLTISSAIVTSVLPDTSGLLAGMHIIGSGVPDGTTILTVDSLTQITLSAVATASGATVSLSVPTLTVTGNTASASPIITNIVPNTTNIHIGMFVTGTGISANSSVVSIDSSTQITLSTNATAAGTGVTLAVESYFPVNQVKGVNYLDGYINVMTQKAAIFSSDINDPMTYPSGDYLVAQIEADPGVYLGKQMVYILAFKKYSLEVFYDAGNPSGSPLGPVQGAKVSIGCRHADSVSSMEGTVFWVSQARDGGTAVYLMDNLKSAQISTPSIERLLQEADYTTVYSWCARVAGHRYYCITLVGSNLSLVYDMTSQQWYQWTDTNGNYLPYVSTTYTGDNQAVFQHATNGKMYKLEITNTTDDGSTITMDLYTPNYDGGVRFKKFAKSMDIIADQTNGSVLKIRVSDDDYQTWSNFRYVDLSKKRPRLTECGTFRRRAYHFQHSSNTMLRIQAVELLIDLGTL